ncbi:MAG: HDOD domain-containing protein [Desulfobacterales bacterium]|jgi:HD-like signal output (HDOD) protein|nr:HDOD domain-containing protein [Desulfobacterales bacterium]
MSYQLILRRFSKKANLSKIRAIFSRGIYLPEQKIKQLMLDQPRIICNITNEKEGEILQSSLDELGCITEIEPIVVDEECHVSMPQKNFAILRKEMSKALRSRTCLGLFWMHPIPENPEESLPSMLGDFLYLFSAYFRESDTVIGMDENQLLLIGFTTDRKGAAFVQNKIHQAFRELLTVPYTVKIGCAIFPDEGRTLPQLFLQAQPKRCVSDAVGRIDIRSAPKGQLPVGVIGASDQGRIDTIQMYFTRARGRFIKRLLGLDAKALWHGLSKLTRKQQVDFLYRLPFDYKLAPAIEKIINSNPKVAPDTRLEKHLAEVIVSMGLEENLADRKRNANSIVLKLKAVESLPVLPGIAVKLFNILSDPEAMVGALAKVIETDTALTLRLLKIVNSAFYGFARKIDTVKEAVIILGTDEIKNLAFGISAAKTFQNIHFKGMTTPHALWRHAIGTAIIAETLGRRIPECKNMGAFTAGLLHDTGKIFLMEQFPKLYNDVYATAIKHKIPVVEAEEEKYELNHAMIGKIIATRWNLPESLSQAILCHHQPMASSEAMFPAAVVGLSDYLYHQVTALSAPAEEMVPPPCLTFGQFTVLKRLFRDMSIASLDAITREMKTLLEDNNDLFTIS